MEGSMLEPENAICEIGTGNEGSDVAKEKLLLADEEMLNEDLCELDALALVSPKLG